jgi:hypothetical protein
MRRVFQIIFLISSLTCFSQSKSDLIGTWKYHIGYFEKTLNLNPDNTYQFSIVGDLHNENSEGIWKLNGNKLILNSFKQKPEETIVIAKYLDSINGVKFHIQDESGFPIPIPQIRIINSQGVFDTLMSTKSGIHNLPKINNIQEFKVSFVGFKDAIWIGKRNMNYFEITLAPELDNYIYQVNEIWKIKGEKLFSPTSKKEYKSFGKRGNTNYYIKEKN